MAENPLHHPDATAPSEPVPVTATQAVASPAAEYVAVGDRSLLCPHCGYDLRAATRDQCPECGRVVDRTTLATSKIPWTHRKEIGWFRAYCRTLIQVSLCSRKLTGEGRKPQSWPAARRFTWISAPVIIGVTLGLLILNWVLDPRSREFGGNDLMVYWSLPDLQRQWLMTISLPWTQGINLPGALECLAVLFMWFLIELPRLILRPASRSNEDRQTAAAIASYLQSPLVLVAVLMLVAPLIVWLALLLPQVMTLFAIVGTLDSILVLGLIISYFANLIGWNHRLNGRTLLAVFTPLTYLLGAALGAVIIGILIPWCVGMILFFATRMG